ncbi:hypothetical protein AKJ09_01734 [Labilithrix luteola]|uniref:Type IV fimbrial biogenesis protein PilY1 n=1 Tax=Labilithrix luteola TaxID=1391654 RepID=A0A0K1PNF2_9BACT|nr:hypothetical protein AKJ09_01734 [Labilithrix luteola]
MFALAAAFAVACADSTDEHENLTSEDGSNDAGDNVDGTVLPTPEKDAGNVDVDVDADVDASIDDDDAVDASDASVKKTCTVQGWCPTQLPPSQTLRAVWGDGTGIAWTVSEQGNILRWDGSAWSIVYTDPGKLYAIWGSGPTDIWVGGVNGVFHGTGATSATLSWTRFPTESNVPVLQMWGTGANDVWAVGNNGTISRIYHYGGPNAGADATGGWVTDPASASVVGLLGRIWGYGPDNVWATGYTTVSARDQPVIWHRAPGDGGVAFTEDKSFTFFARNTLYGGITSDTNNIIWYGLTSVQPYIYWQKRADSTQPYTWTNAASVTYPNTPSCNNQVHNGVFGATTTDFWTFGEYGRLCHFDGKLWSAAAVSVDPLPMTNTFWAAWGPDGATSPQWVVGQDVAIRKQATGNP